MNPPYSPSLSPGRSSREDPRTSKSPWSPKCDLRDRRDEALTTRHAAHRSSDYRPVHRPTINLYPDSTTVQFIGCKRPKTLSRAHVQYELPDEGLQDEVRGKQKFCRASVRSLTAPFDPARRLGGADEAFFVVAVVLVERLGGVDL